MYTPEINLLRDRALTTTTGAVPIPTEKPAGSSGGAVAVLAGLLVAGAAVGSVTYFQMTLAAQLNEITRERDAIAAQVKASEEEVARLTAIKTEFDGISARINAFKSFFNDIQPWSAILEDLRARVPREVWLTSMAVNGNQVTLNGVSLSFEQVNDLQLTLLQSPFVQGVTLSSSQLNPGNETRLASVNFSYTVDLRPLTLASDEVLNTLSRTGSEGLVAKVNILRDLDLEQPQQPQ
ncbi:MAG: PilN domain-containing protein [Thermostichales cyanobacterium BF4_bins_65]